jgi:tubulin polyglutamylase TTLL2
LLLQSMTISQIRTISHQSPLRYDESNLDDIFSHLTNSSINKFSPHLDESKEEIGAGCKWTLNQLRKYFARKGLDFKELWNRYVYLSSTHLLYKRPFDRIKSIIILTLISITDDIPPTRGCFELYGFGMMDL